QKPTAGSNPALSANRRSPARQPRAQRFVGPRMFGYRPDIPRPSGAAIDKARRLLDAALGPSKVLGTPEACERFMRDESETAGTLPDAVVLATGADDIAKALAVAREAGVLITPRAGGTGRSGGAVPVAGGILLCTLGMNQIKDIDRREGVAVV